MSQAHKDQKVEISKTIRERFDRSVSAVILDPRGVSVLLTTELRARFRQAGIDYKVFKNTLIHKALVGTPLENDAAFEKAIVGMTGLAFSYEDPSAAAKIVRDFRKEGDANEKLRVKGAVLDNTVFAGDRVESEVATLPGKNEIRATLLAQLLAPAQRLVMQLAAPQQNFAYALDARRRQLENA